MGLSRTLTRYLLRKELSLKERERDRRRDFIVWVPNPGDMVMGRLVERGRMKTRYGNREYLKIDTNKDVYLVYLNHILARELETEGVDVGKDIAIKFQGKVSRDGRDYNTYLVSSLPLNLKVRSPILRILLFIAQTFLPDIKFRGEGGGVSACCNKGFYGNKR